MEEGNCNKIHLFCLVAIFLEKESSKKLVFKRCFSSPLTCHFDLRTVLGNVMFWHFLYVMLEKCDFTSNDAIWTRVSIDVEEWNQKDNWAAYNEGDFFKVIARPLRYMHLARLIFWFLLFRSIGISFSFIMFFLCLEFQKLVCDEKRWLLKSELIYFLGSCVC